MWKPAKGSEVALVPGFPDVRFSGLRYPSFLSIWDLKPYCLSTWTFRGSWNQRLCPSHKQPAGQDATAIFDPIHPKDIGAEGLGLRKLGLGFEALNL